MATLTYYYLIITQKDLLKSQLIEEIFREKVAYYLAKNKQRDFWLSLAPKFILTPSIFLTIQKSNFYFQRKKSFSGFNIKGLHFEYSLASLISLDKKFIDWLQLRLGFFENIDNIDLLKKSRFEDYTSNGIKGMLSSQSSLIVTPFITHKSLVYSDIVLSRNDALKNMYLNV